MTDLDRITRELREAAEKATPAPWLYRPQATDDWGWLRTSERTRDGFSPLVACVRSGLDPQKEDLDAHRRQGADPYAHNAVFIVLLRNHIIPILDDRDRLKRELDAANARVRELERTAAFVYLWVNRPGPLSDAERLSVIKHRPGWDRFVKGAEPSDELTEQRTRAEAAEARAARLHADVEKLREELGWYGENARLARLIHSEGDPGRHALAGDGGKRANRVLADTAPDASDGRAG